MINKNTLAAVAFSSMVFFSCTTSNNNNNGGPGLMKVNGVHDIQVSMDYSDSMELYVDGMEENVSLAFTGLPDGVQSTISPSSGVPEFSSFARFNSLSAIPGTYDCQLVCQGSKSGKKTYNFQTVVKGAAICGLLTAYNATSNCNANYVENITGIVPTVETAINDIRFQNFGGRGFAVTAKANCNNRTILVPLQSINGSTSISGEGTFTSTGSIQINYVITVNGSSTSCWFTLQRYNL